MRVRGAKIYAAKLCSLRTALLDGTVIVEKCAYQVENENYGHELSFT